MTTIKKQNNTIEEYLGTDFQFKLFWQLLTSYEFSEKVIPLLSLEYFDDPNMRKLFLIMKNYYEENEVIPNLLNKSISLAIKKHFNGKNSVEEEIITAKVNELSLYNDRVLNDGLPYDGLDVQRECFTFIKQQEYRKQGEDILSKVKSGQIKDKKIIYSIEENFLKITRIGDDENYGTDIFSNIKNVLRDEFRETVPTGINFIDNLTGGGLGKGEIGMIIAPLGVGKTTILTKIANSAYEAGKNVLQIIFEDTDEQVQRKHFAIWAKTALNEFSENSQYVEDMVTNKMATHTNNKLIIKKFSQDSTTIIDVKNFIIKYQKKFGIKFELVVLDYLDCLESHKKTADGHEAEFAIVKSFESMAGELNVPMWTAIQGNRSSVGSEWVETSQMGGNIKRAQKAHFVMSIAKTDAQKVVGLANCIILKSRFGSDGVRFENIIFNNGTLEIRTTNGDTASQILASVKEIPIIPQTLLISEDKTKELQAKIDIIQGNVTDFDVNIATNLDDCAVEKNIIDVPILTQSEVIKNIDNFFDGI